MTPVRTDSPNAGTFGCEDDTRMIETAFPIKAVSLDSVHEKNVRHGHISTLHIWPARRPLAASRAVLLATLIRATDSPAHHNSLLSRIAGQITEIHDPDTGQLREITEGGVLHWGRESCSDLDVLRNEILDSFGGRIPRVFDPFAGGGAIPLEAMRLGCEVVASDINPVAWFLLRCTLHYPRLLTQSLPLPSFVLKDREFMIDLLKSRGLKKDVELKRMLAHIGHDEGSQSQIEMDTISPDPNIHCAKFEWHLRAWGKYVLQSVRKKLAAYYPTFAEFEPILQKSHKGHISSRDADVEDKPMRLLEPDEEGRVSSSLLNGEFDSSYILDGRNPRWIVKPTVAYIWARTVQCSNCRINIPLLKTLWLCKEARSRALLIIDPNMNGQEVSFKINTIFPPKDSTRLKEHQKHLPVGAGTMTKNGATCPRCLAIMPLKDIRARGRTGLLGTRMVAVVVNGQAGKEFRLPRQEEFAAAQVASGVLQNLFSQIPFGLPTEPTPKSGSGASRAFSIYGYGFDQWYKIFTSRQLLVLGTFVTEIRRITSDMGTYPREWVEGLRAYLAPTVGRIADRGSGLATWTNAPPKIRNTFARFALPMVWDFAESCPLNDSTGGFSQAVEWVARVFNHLRVAEEGQPVATVLRQSAVSSQVEGVDVVCTDPPYYDAIPYSDLMDFFYVWLRRILHGLSDEYNAEFGGTLGPKWNQELQDGELIDDARRFGGDRSVSKLNYEQGMQRVFSRLYQALNEGGRLVVVFANKKPDAWETLVSALIRSGFVVTGSWPIQTEMKSRQRSLSSAALSSSIWLVCRKRESSASIGWDHKVLEVMQQNISRHAHEFWDAGIRGPDFIWAALGPALQAFSLHPVVKKADRQGEFLTVAEFLRSVRRIVVSFVVSKILQGEGQSDELDDLTTYYLLHRRDFGLTAAPAGACILYALSCNLSDTDLVGRSDILVRSGRLKSPRVQAEGETQRGSTGGELQLKAWSDRRMSNLGDPGADGESPPLIDCVHRLMHLWKTGEQSRVDGYLSERGLWGREILARVVQALIELADQGSEERATLESIQNHLRRSGIDVPVQQGTLL